MRPFSNRFSIALARAAALVSTLVTAGCASGPEAVVSGVYERESRLLVRLDYDHDGDGRIDVRTYMRNGRPVRLEADSNADGLIDRWEYYDLNGALLRIGGSTAGDGREDTWIRSNGRQRFVDISTRRDGRIDRREVYERDALVHAESDANQDGLSDRWEDFHDGRIVRLMLDEELRHGRPTRRIVYGAREAARVETDTDGDGVWETDAAR